MSQYRPEIMVSGLPGMNRKLAIAVVIGSLVAVAVPIAPAIAAADSRDDFRRCAAALTRVKLPQEEAVLACSRSLYPQYLHECVTDVNRVGYEAAEALGACRQVRRPVDMAYCVTGIRRSLNNSDAGEVLDNCRRTLLPLRYSDCVVGLSQGSSGLTPTNALASCNDAQYFPREVDPTFIPYSATQPSLVVPESTPEVTAPAPQPPAPAPSRRAPTGPVRGLY